MAYQCQSHYLLGLAYLDSVDVAAKLLVDSTHRLLARVADALAGTEYLAYGPDAGVSQRTYERFLAAADQLRDIDLTIEPAPPVVLDSAADVGQVMTVSAVRPQ